MPSKRVISFSVWGDNHAYTAGAVANALIAPKVYPGWVCRFYCDSKVPTDDLKALIDLGAEIVMKPESDDFMGLYWRFEPMYDDPTIERFIVRDTDSRLNGREKDAVDEWIESGHLFHIMRDNPSHNIYVMGGMWGSVPMIIPEFETLMRSWIVGLKPDKENPKGKYHGTDQMFLCKVIWPYIKHCHLAHTDLDALKYTQREKPFRVKLNRDGYVGMIWSEKDQDRCEVQNGEVPDTGSIASEYSDSEAQMNGGEA